MSTHESHPDILKRLRRLEGHLRKVVEMIETGRPCVDIAQQMQAVEGAIRSAKKILIHDHIEHCLDEVVIKKKEAMKKHLSEFKKITKYL